MQDAFWWTLTLALMLIGLVGTVAPLIPGTTIIFCAAVLHHYALGRERGAGWWTLGAMLALTMFSYFIEFASGVMGARKFGASRWGAAGGLVGAVVGLFFGLPGLFLGPLLGVLIGEILGGKGLVPAGRSTWGTLLGTTAGMVAKLIVGIVMISWFLISTLWWRH